MRVPRWSGAAAVAKAAGGAYSQCLGFLSGVSLARLVSHASQSHVSVLQLKFCGRYENSCDCMRSFRDANIQHPVTVDGIANAENISKCYGVRPGFWAQRFTVLQVYSMKLDQS